MQMIKTPPFSVEAEQGVVGGILLEPDWLPSIAAIVQPSDFYRDDNKAIYLAMMEMHALGRGIDIITVSDYMDVAGTLEQAGGLAYIGTLRKNTTSTANIKVYAQIVKERSSARAIQRQLQKGLDAIGDPNGRDIKEIINEVRERINDAADSATTSNPIALRLAAKIETDSAAALARMKNQRWLVDQVLPQDCFGVIFGPSGGYKSFLALDIAASVAAAKEWHGHQCDSIGSVLYIAAEGSQGLHMRKVGWQNRYQIKADSLGILGSVVNLSSMEDTHALIEAAKAFQDQSGKQLRLIVVDTLARTFDGDENSASDMGAFVRCCDMLRQELDGATVLVVHHSGKDADRGARGSSALRAACDFEFKVVPQGKKATKISCEKAKDSEPFDDMNFVLDVVDLGEQDAKGKQMYSLAPRLVESLPQAADEVSQNTGVVLDVIEREMARNGDDSVFTNFARDAFFASMGASKSDEKVKKQWRRGLDDLIKKDWIAVEGDKIVRKDRF